MYKLIFRFHAQVPPHYLTDVHELLELLHGSLICLDIQTLAQSGRML